MKKEQMTYIGIGLLIVFVFMLVTMNTSSVSRSSDYSGYTFNNDLGRSAGRMNSGVRIVNPPRQSLEGFLSGSSLKPESPNWRIEDYLDNSRGPECAGKSFGITASGGPLCLTPEQARAMASRGSNTDESGCMKNYYN